MSTRIGGIRGGNSLFLGLHGRSVRIATGYDPWAVSRTYCCSRSRGRYCSAFKLYSSDYRRASETIPALTSSANRPERALNRNLSAITYGHVTRPRDLQQKQDTGNQGLAHNTPGQPRLAHSPHQTENDPLENDRGVSVMF